MTTTMKTMTVRSALAVDHRDDKILAERLAFAVRNVSRYGTIARAGEASTGRDGRGQGEGD